MFSFKVYGWLLSRNVLFYLETQQIWLFSPLSVLRTYSLCCDLGNSHVTSLGLLCVPFISHFLRFTISLCPVSAYGLTDIPLRPKVTKSLERIQLLGLFSCLVLIPDSIMSSKPISVMVAEGKIQQIEKSASVVYICSVWLEIEHIIMKHWIEAGFMGRHISSMVWITIRFCLLF